MVYETALARAFRYVGFSAMDCKRLCFPVAMFILQYPAAFVIPLLVYEQCSAVDCAYHVAKRFGVG